MSEIWNTKYGRRRVRFDPPTLKEAIVAAQGLTSDLEQQAEIAAALMEVPIEDVRAKLLIMAPVRNSEEIVTSSGRDGGARTVIVERKPSRHFVARLERVQQKSEPVSRQDTRQNKGLDQEDDSKKCPLAVDASRLGPAMRLAARPSCGGDRQGSRTLLRLGLLDRKPVPS